MTLRSSYEGYVLIDHRDSPGITQKQAAMAGCGAVAVPAGRRLEAATYTCSHCGCVVVKRPERTRARGYCPKCDRNVCDRCETNRVLTGECTPRQMRIDQWFEKAVRGII